MVGVFGVLFLLATIMAEAPTTSDVLVLEIPLTLHTVILTSIPPIVAEKLLPVVIDPTPRAKRLVTTITVLTGIVLLLMRSTEISFVPTRTRVVITKLHEGQVLRPPGLDHARCLVHHGKFVSVGHLFLLRRTSDKITDTYESVLDDGKMETLSSKTAEDVKMETRVDVIRTTPFTFERLHAAVEYCLPYDDEGHKKFRKLYTKISLRSDANQLTVADAMEFFSRTIEGGGDEKEKTDRFIGFLCGERVGYYETLEDLYYVVKFKIDETTDMPY